MANRTFTGETDSNLNTATNWALDTAPSDGDTIILDADSNAPDGYADGTPPETPLTTAGTFSLSLAGGARVVLTDMLSDLGDVATQHLNNVVVDGALSWLNNDSAGTVGGPSLYPIMQHWPQRLRLLAQAESPLPTPLLTKGAFFLLLP